MIDMTMHDDICMLTINRPKANALSQELIAELKKQLDGINAKVVVIKGEGRFFSAGADIHEFSGKSAQELSAQSAAVHEVFNQIADFHIPIIALIKGAALGGGLELAMACHIRYATVDAQLGLPELKLGLIPGYSGTRRLQSLVGASKALEMILTAETMNGAEAEQAGLVSKAFASEEEMERFALVTARKISSYSSDSITGIMHVQREGDAQRSDEVEAEVFGGIFSTDNAKEGLLAFKEKREPHFK